MSGYFGADVLARTYYHRLTAFRPLQAGGEEVVCREAPCALSRSAHTSAPMPPDGAYVLPEALYRLSLFTRPELLLRLGDRVEVTDESRRVFRGRASDSVCYPSHCITVVEISEVRALPPSGEDEGGGACEDVGQDSGEDGEEAGA